MKIVTGQSSFGSAGDYFVAYRVASLGFVPAMICHGARTVDLLVSNSEGSRTVGIQVQTAFNARRTKGLDNSDASLEFPLSRRSVHQASDENLFCFVDLRGCRPETSPEVYVMQARVLKEKQNGVFPRKYAPSKYASTARELQPYLENWRPLLERLLIEPAIPLRWSAAIREPASRFSHSVGPVFSQ